MQMSSLATLPNLKLAWRRITTGGNHQYKRFFRQLYYAYELALDKNLRDLRTRLLALAWEPQHPDRIYLPKPSGLQRPLSLMYLEDQIVLQALANLVARRIEARRAPMLDACVFSNIPEAPDSIFFVRDWRRTYHAFGQSVDDHYRRGRIWVADFDLAAFYDTISHELLLRTAYTRLQDSDDVRFIRRCLSTWTAATRHDTVGHGLPQGPIASDFLAEVFLLPIDQTMQGTPGYVRYVDDVRLFSETESSLRQAVIQLDILCKQRGLIPQVGKFSLRKASSAADARGMLPSVGASRD